MGVCMTQWRTGFAGATGLDYAAVVAVAPVVGVHLDDPVLARLRVLEDETLVMWAEEAAKKKESKP